MPRAAAARNRARSEGLCGSGPRPFGDREHLGRLAGVEAGVGGLGEHRHSLFWIRPFGGGGEDRVTAHHRPAARGDVASKRSISTSGRVAAGARLASSARARSADRPSQAVSPPAAAAEPAARARPLAAPLARARRQRSHTRCDAAARAGVLERRRCGVVGADRRGGEMPGAAVDIVVGQGGGERAVRLAALGRDAAA